ncbi:MAG: CRISPR-associated protein Cas5 [Dehalobacterium sp.]|jgi:CRISPR-associated protein Cas5h
MKELLSFRYSGRIAHFLRAEAGASALSYPIPPRTVILGLAGAVLGLAKDQSQQILKPFQVALAGRVPQTLWHKAKLRKDPPETLPMLIKGSHKMEKTTKPEQATLITQEWLFNPEYTLWIGLPEPYHTELEQRLKKRRWHYQPSLGLSEMMADLHYLGKELATPLPDGIYNVTSVIRQSKVEVQVVEVLEKNLAIQLLRMPRSVTKERFFTHEGYFLERDGKTIPVRTSHAYKVGGKVIMLL